MTALLRRIRYSLGSRLAVSYTHLDVYKRQEISRAQDLLSSAGSRLTSAQQSSLNNQISQLQTLISDPYADINAVDTATKALRDLVDSISSSLPSEPDPSPSESPEPSDSPEVSPSPTE